MQDSSQSTTGDPVQDKRAKVHRIQADMTIMDSDFRKNERNLDDMKLKLRSDKHKRDTLEVEIEEGEKEIRKLEGEQMILEAEIRKLRKKLNLLS